MSEYFFLWRAYIPAVCSGFQRKCRPACLNSFLGYSENCVTFVEEMTNEVSLKLGQLFRDLQHYSSVAKKTALGVMILPSRLYIG